MNGNRRMTFSLEPCFKPSTQEEREISDVLNRKVHGDDLEDDFFDLAGGIREEDAESGSESSVEEVEEAEEVEEDECNEKTSEKEMEAEDISPAPGIKKDCFALLVEEINRHSEKQFNALNSMFQPPRPTKKRNKKKEANYDECNQILNGLASLYTPEAAEAEAKKPRKQQKKEEEQRCGNWEDQKTSPKYKPNII